MLEIKEICLSREGQQILDNVNLTINDREFVALTGPNGSGKSTLAKVIMGMEKPDSGKIILDGKDITDLSIDQRANLGIGFGFQTPVTFKGITVMDLIRLASGSKISKKEACAILSSVGLCAKGYIGREINNSLSGGELKRIEISSVLARGSKISIFDEPEAGIDLWSFSNLIEVFNNLREAKKGNIIVISHQERILEIADKIVLLNKGQVSKVYKHGESMDDLFSVYSCWKMKEE